MDLRHMIREKGYRLGWVAAQIGITPVQFSRMIHGHATLPADKVSILAKTLKVKVGDILNIIECGSE